MPSYSEIRPWALEPLAPDLGAPRDTPDPGEAEPAPPTLCVDPRAALEAAWEEGFQSGYRDGLRAAREEQEAATLKLIQLAQQAFTDAHEFIRNLEREVVGLSLAIAEKVTESAVRVDPTAVVEVVHAALTEVQHATVVQVRVNPADYEIVRVQWEHILPRASLRSAELVPDDRVQQGGCIIETDTGMADGQLATKLRQIAQMFEAVAEGDVG